MPQQQQIIVDTMTSHHEISAAAIALPVISLWARVPEVITTVAATLGVIWYIILFTEKIMLWVKLRKAKNNPPNWED